MRLLADLGHLVANYPEDFIEKRLYRRRCLAQRATCSEQAGETLLKSTMQPLRLRSIDGAAARHMLAIAASARSSRLIVENGPEMLMPERLPHLRVAQIGASLVATADHWPTAPTSVGPWSRPPPPELAALGGV